jgi:hypothetical protein
MSEYFFAKKNAPTPIYMFPDFYEEGAPSNIFTYPNNPIPVLAKYRPKTDYEITDIFLFPEFSISSDIFNKIELKEIYGGNWIPIKLIERGEHDYMMLQLNNEIDVIDKKNSRFDKSDENGFIIGMEKLRLDNKKLMGIPLNKRLIFEDEFWGYYRFYHKSVVDIIMQENPTGIKFVPISDFNESWAG